jgi:hypothetical protein
MRTVSGILLKTNRLYLEKSYAQQNINIVKVRLIPRIINGLVKRATREPEPALGEKWRFETPDSSA